MQDLRLVVGLGNPGPRYERTRHNVGYMVARALADKHRLRLSSSKHAADISRGTVQGIPILIALPVTFMNESGIAVSRLMRYYHVSIDRLIVICDDIDLPFGTLRLRSDGGSGGNGGLKSIIQSVGSQDFGRVRLGVSRPTHDAIDHVLGVFPPDEARLLPGLLGIAVDAVETVLSQGIRAAMNEFNRDWLPSLEGASESR